MNLGKNGILIKTFLRLVGIIKSKIGLNQTLLKTYFYTNQEEVFEVKEINSKGFEYMKNDKLRKINKTKYEIELDCEKYTFKNLKVFLGIA